MDNSMPNIRRRIIWVSERGNKEDIRLYKSLQVYTTLLHHPYDLPHRNRT